MTESLTIFGSLLGGLGLFLLAIGMMTDGLRQSAGGALRKILSDWTNTPFKGIVSGFLMTALVQSSSAVTVASVGFVNAGLLAMRQTLGIIYGANIGTTITGWLVALIGFKFNIQVFALPLIGIGMILHLSNRESRKAAIGLALVGFGLFFVGIDILKTTFEGLVATFDMTQIKVDGVAEIFAFLVVGVVMTVLTQSSSASIALTIAAAASGVIGIYTAAAMVIGANVGTTSTAVFASIGATANAKRVALAQVLFNVGTGAVALLVLPLMFLVIKGLSDFFSVSVDVALTLALFHTVFNVLGVILVYPLNDRLAKFLETRFVSRDEKVSLPKYLDNTLTATPVLAVNALVMELDAIEHRVRDLVSEAVRDPEYIASRELTVVRQLSASVSKFISKLERNNLSEETAGQLEVLLRIDQYLLSCAITASHIAEKQARLSHNDLFGEDLDVFLEIVLETFGARPADETDQLIVDVKDHHDKVKAVILKRAAIGSIHFEVMLERLDFIGDLLKMTQQWLKALKYLQRLVVDTRVSLDQRSSSKIENESADVADQVPAAPSGNEPDLNKQ